MGELILVKPIGAAEGEKEGHKYGSRGGQHRGVDYPATEGTRVIASESGLVLRAANNPVTTKRKKAFGNVIVIYHNPEKPSRGTSKNRHIYTLYAHLDCMFVKRGDYVGKYEAIGTVGSTGYSTGPHLHFEVIDSRDALGWLEGNASDGAMGIKSGVTSKNPNEYYNIKKEVDGTLVDMVERAIIDRMECVPDIDFGRRDFIRMQVWLDGRNLGDMKNIGSIAADLNYDLKSELRRLH